jgi:hypothetical protein
VSIFNNVTYKILTNINILTIASSSSFTKLFVKLSLCDLSKKYNPTAIVTGNLATRPPHVGPRNLANTPDMATIKPEIKNNYPGKTNSQH